MNINDFEVIKVDENTEKKLLGLFGLFLKGQEREDYLLSKRVDLSIKNYVNSGKNLSKEEIDKIKFAYDPIFKEKVIKNVHKDCDKEYNAQIKQCDIKIKSLEGLRENEIKRIEQSRWRSVANNCLMENPTEGKVMINGTPVLYSSIRGATLNVNYSERIVTTEKGKSKKRGSLGGAVVGGFVAGPIGAVVGGATLGKTTYKSRTNSDCIPTSNHVGVIVDIDGFNNEIVLLSKMVDQSSHTYHNAISNAQSIITALQQLSRKDVPETFLKVTEEQSVLEFDRQIEEAKVIREEAVANVPTYDIPSRYL